MINEVNYICRCRTKPTTPTVQSRGQSRGHRSSWGSDNRTYYMFQTVVCLGNAGAAECVSLDYVCSSKQVVLNKHTHTHTQECDWLIILGSTHNRVISACLLHGQCLLLWAHDYRLTWSICLLAFCSLFHTKSDLGPLQDNQRMAAYCIW